LNFTGNATLNQIVNRIVKSIDSIDQVKENYMDEHNSQIVQLKKKLKEYQEQVEYSEKKSARYEAEVAQLKESLKGHRKQVKQGEKLASEHQITIEELKEKLKEYQKKERPDFTN